MWVGLAKGVANSLGAVVAVVGVSFTEPSLGARLELASLVPWARGMASIATTKAVPIAAETCLMLTMTRRKVFSSIRFAPIEVGIMGACRLGDRQADVSDT
ncbi:hypothetical protein M1247_13440 [Mycobacterium sp. 21AC1]|uniref:hypothetical protein n=1 Tax=[Mycobacterium] appelbergii TaxID=2939269 RepID=UPI002939035D|nr:hypothetical protein [Mycobacterium sp. 21AC1]MDV3125927.1 hypothetical protein [Mycobacterium sp. 21AC1]